MWTSLSTHLSLQMTPRELRNVHNTRNSCRNTLPCATWHYKTTWYFYLLMEKPLRCYFQVWSPYYQVALCNQKISVPVFSRWQVRSQKAKRKISINTNHNYHQRSSPLVSLNRSNNKIKFRFNQPNKRCGVRLADAIKHLTHKNEPI